MTMEGADERLVALTETLVSALVDDVEALTVTSSDGEDGSLVINVTVAEDETGKVIGRQGRVIKAIRTVVRAAASQDDLSVEVEVVG